MELALSQSTDPHRQLPPSFADVPSVILQDEAGREQVLVSAVQTMPVPSPSPLLSQSADPHRQPVASSFAEVPSVIPHAAYLLHVLSAATQNIPVVPDPVHAVVPQMQGALSLLGADPSVVLQAGAVRVQMHVLEVEQDLVEEVPVLTHRSSQESL